MPRCDGIMTDGRWCRRRWVPHENNMSRERDYDNDDDGTNKGCNRKDEYRGRPMGLYKALNIEELANKLPRTT